MPWLSTKCKKKKRKKDLKLNGPSWDQNCDCWDNPEQNFWDKIEKSSNTGQGKHRLISTFACFFTAIAKI